MFSFLILTCIAGTAAFTPSNFQPSSAENLTVAYGSTSALNGVVVAKADTASAPTLGTATQLTGTYTVMMVDPDVPNGNGSTAEFLHWMQAGFTSASTTSTIAGQTVFELVNAANTSALAAYIQPGPPAEVPFSHRYVQMILNTTGMDINATFGAAAASRGGFDAANVVKSAGLTVIMGNSFNVTADSTNTDTVSSTNSTSSSKGSKGSKSGKSGKGNSTSGSTSNSTSNSTSSTTSSGKKSGKGSSNSTSSSMTLSSGKNSTSSSGSHKGGKNSTSSSTSSSGSTKAGKDSSSSDTSTSTSSSVAALADSTAASEASASSSATVTSVAGERLAGASSLMAAVGLFVAALVLL